MNYHKDKYGNRTPIKDLKTDHLKNIIRLNERMAKEGITVREGGGSCPDDYWYDEYELLGEEALEHLNHQAYVKELSSR